MPPTATPDPLSHAEETATRPWGQGAPATAEQRQQLARNYEALLRRVLTHDAAALALHGAALGQRALALGLGLLDLLEIHGNALAALGDDGGDDHDAKAAEEILTQVLAPYENAFHQLQVANAKLRYRLLLQQQRRQTLAAAHARLQAELRQHAATETILREQAAAQDQRFEALIALQEELKRLCTQVLMLHEAEQKRLSQELERSVGGWLDIVDDNLAALASREPDPRSRQKLAGPRRQLRRAAKAARQLAEELYPPVLDNMSLAFGLRECLTGFQERTGAAGSFHCRGNFQRVDAPSRLVLYRIAREIFAAPLLTGPAERVDMSLHQVNGSIQMQIAFSGNGPPPALPPPPSQLHLLQERVRLLNGQFTTGTDSGKTATYRVDLPLAPHPRDPRPS